MIYLHLDMSVLVDRLTGQQVDKNGLLIMPSTHIISSLPVNPDRQVERLTGQQHIQEDTITSDCRHVNPGRQVDRSTGEQ